MRVPSWMELVPYKRDPIELLHPFHPVRIQGGVMGYEPEKLSSTDSKSVGIFILDEQPLKL